MDLAGSAQTETGGVPVVYTGIDIFRIEDGKLAELWQNTDDLGLEQQFAAAAARGRRRRERQRRSQRGGRRAPL